MHFEKSTFFLARFPLRLYAKRLKTFRQHFLLTAFTITYTNKYLTNILGHFYFNLELARICPGTKSPILPLFSQICRNVQNRNLENMNMIFERGSTNFTNFYRLFVTFIHKFEMSENSPRGYIRPVPIQQNTQFAAFFGRLRVTFGAFRDSDLFCAHYFPEIR